MTATDELRRLLDERGVEWTYGDGTVSFSDGKHWCHAWAYNDDTMCVSMGYFTPEQAIEATLGRGECRNKATRPQTFWCDQCDCAAEGWVDVGGMLINGFRYCPWCGRKVRV